MIPVDKNELFTRLEKDKAELRREMNDIALLILKRLDACVCKEVKKVIPVTKKK